MAPELLPYRLLNPARQVEPGIAMTSSADTTRGDLLWETIPKLVRTKAQEQPDAVAIADTDRDKQLSYNQLQAAVERAGKAFIASGIEPDDRVAVWAPNMAEWIIAAIGLQAAGAVLVPLNTRFKGREAGFVIQKSGASMLLCTQNFLDTDYVALLGQAHGPATADLPVKGLPDLAEIVSLDTTPSGVAQAIGALTSWQDFLSRAERVSDAELQARINARRSQDLSDILFTSGTTGMPKGVMTTHAQSLRGYKVWSDLVGLTSSDRYLVVNPFFHGFGYKAGWLASIMAGCAIYPHAVFDVEKVMRKVAIHRISVMPGPPTLYQSILNHPQLPDFDLTSLRLAVTGAAVIPVELIRQMRDHLGFETVVTGYGLTESSAIATMCRHDDDPETIATTSGCAIAGVEVRIADDDGFELPRGQAGEVLVRGYNVMQGYFGDPEATLQAIDSEGWLHTGDIGVMNDQGYIAITDRKKDMFIVGGFNAYPAEIENLILAHESVAQVAVVGTPDERMGEVGAAFVVPKLHSSGEPHQINDQDFLDWCKTQMANYKVPKKVIFLPELPTNASGKVLKFQLRDMVS